MARRSFSMMLAWRYLNPRRAFLSVVAFISVMGVMFGVLVLVVVMSVYSGLEREVKSRLLGFIPHIKLEFSPFGTSRTSVADWRGMVGETTNLPGVTDASPFVQDNVGIDIASFQSAGIYRGIDTNNPDDVAGITAMLDLEAFPESTADMGLDDRVVVSSKLARSFRAGVGDTIRLYSWRNFDEVKRVFDATNRPPVYEEFETELAEVRKILTTGWAEAGDQRSLTIEQGNRAYNPLFEIYQQNIRAPERELLEQALQILDSVAPEPDSDLILFPAAAAADFTTIFTQLDAIDPEKIDGELLKDMREVVLPKEAVIVGVYQASQMALTPDVFMPLHLAQNLSGLGDEVQAVALRLEDPYQAALVADVVRKELPDGWRTITWMEEISDFSQILSQQRVMMYFALCFIILNSVFSMTAVMFTVTIQKRREIGVMKALGAAPGQIVKVFVYQGMILGSIGVLLGVGLGLLVIHFRGELQSAMRFFGFDPFPSHFLGFNQLPAHINPAEIGWISLFAFVLCTGAALIPAFAAARSDAAKSLRNL